jgi:hypothetical protein
VTPLLPIEVQGKLLLRTSQAHQGRETVELAPASWSAAQSAALDLGIAVSASAKALKPWWASKAEFCSALEDLAATRLVQILEFSACEVAS